MSSKTPSLRDVALESPGRALEFPIQAVGLENVQMQVLFEGQRLPARGQASVSLVDPQSRGIHMSRLFKVMTEFSNQELSWDSLTQALETMLGSQGHLSDRGELSLSFDWAVLRPALLSQTQGWRVYPIMHRVQLAQGQSVIKELEVKVLYSSTCPCSASLSRQAIEDRFRQDFDGQANLTRDKVMGWLHEQGIVAVPHAQRSEAIGRFTLGSNIHPLTLIDQMESALSTPVQAAVKRQDEQEFARRNAQNLMFCEDAARRLKAAFVDRKDVTDFSFEVRHFESLHPHDVVAKIQKFD